MIKTPENFGMFFVNRIKKEYVGEMKCWTKIPCKSISYSSINSSCLH